MGLLYNAFVLWIYQNASLLHVKQNVNGPLFYTLQRVILVVFSAVD